MEYNTQREPLIIPEYGRNVKKMVDYCMTIQDKYERSEYARGIVVAMSSVNPNGKDSPNYLHKLWNHLFIISDYKLDISSPFAKPVREEKNEKPKPLKYKGSNIRIKTYGKFLQQIIAKVATMEDSEEKSSLTSRIAQEMKKAHLQWNINSCDNDVILKHLDLLSDGRLKVHDDFQFKTTKEILGKRNNNQRNQNNNQRNQNNKKKVTNTNNRVK